MKKGLRQSETKTGFAKSGYLKMKFSPKLGFTTSITSESYRFRKNRCDYRTKSKNIYAPLNPCVNVFSSQALSRKGFQSRKNYRLLKESVDATRSQSFSETQKPQKRRGKASLSYIRRWKSLEKLRKDLAFHILAIREARISHENLPEGLSPSYLRFSAAFGRENSVYSVQNLIRFYAFSVSVVKRLFCRQKTVYGIREQQNKPWCSKFDLGFSSYSVRVSVRINSTGA